MKENSNKLADMETDYSNINRLERKKAWWNGFSTGCFTCSVIVTILEIIRQIVA